DSVGRARVDSRLLCIRRPQPAASGQPQGAGSEPGDQVMRALERSDRRRRAPFRDAGLKTRTAVWLGVSLAGLAAFGACSCAAMRLAGSRSPLHRRLAVGEERLAA